MTYPSIQQAAETRRSVYALNKNLPLPTAEVTAFIQHAVLHTPSAFNSQSTRVVALFGAEHEKLWQFAEDALRAIVPAEKFESTQQKLNMFKAAAGSVLFFEDQEVPCPVCSGRRFKDEVLSVTYRGHSITGVLGLSVEEGAELFADSPKISAILELLQEVGLGYLELGQTTTTLSGGEAQRLKLAVELLVNQGKKNLYLIDEPTTGLHPLDVEKFLKLLDRMVGSGSTVVVVEHNQQIIGAADWIIDLGPGGGDAGGTIIAEGTPSEIRKNENSVTGMFI